MMHSIFENADNQAQGSYKFWMPIVQNSEGEIHRGNLYSISKSQMLKERNYSLTSKFLIKSSQTCPKAILLEWKVMEPFIEENSKIPRYGFRLGHGSHMKDFYVPDESSLKIWIQKLSGLCIMTGIFDDYYFVKSIGKGEFVEIFLAESLNESKKFAIKAIEKNFFAENPEMINNLINEIKINRKCSHPNIIKLHRVYESETHIYLVLDHVEGGDLFTRIIKRKRFNEETILKLSYKLISVLSYLESLNIAHRDIKLENILMVSQDNDYEFKLADFGLSEEVNGFLHKKCGSLGYIAPEIINRIPYGTKADLFSAGVVLYILFIGKMPFFGKTSHEILMKNKNCNIPFNEFIWKIVQRNFFSFIFNLLQKDQNFRTPARDLLNHPWFSENRAKLEEMKDRD